MEELIKRDDWNHKNDSRVESRFHPESKWISEMGGLDKK